MRLLDKGISDMTKAVASLENQTRRDLEGREPKELYAAQRKEYTGGLEKLQKLKASLEKKYETIQ